MATMMTRAASQSSMGTRPFEVSIAPRGSPSRTCRHAVAVAAEWRTLLWNAVPFHPAKDGQTLTNRTPTVAERKAGEEWLRRLVALTQPGLVVAIGRKAPT